ncbi:uncharacterized protein NDAI_0G01040 [Naumovozyma dairenensis CBS 421]|uniref:Uncharacterized protein n=1 Tax=Naumovozyma dairenensis (strain ATCC 10597 / BCRC 20456 / CBS 421 / NBRC 0211 / NRRL Y-12639) TaxID=1071378 RepID=G0WDL9_NAUDC|nr:hypothetical protein NDAI_0G01040 [Naumovozyma dairenensis CBS 421]CCD25880.2 hypothetical protein NDAI_0G01040 [Naumovozyma dairenensis CBS 421]
MKESTSEKYIRTLVAQYLQKKGFKSTLASFLNEANVPLAVTKNENQEQLDDLETIIKERIQFNEHNISDKLKRLTLNDFSTNNNNTSEYSSHFSSWDYKKIFVEQSHVECSGIPLSVGFDAPNDEDIVVSTSAKEVNIYGNKSGDLLGSLKPISGIAKLCGSIGNYYYTASMDGSLNIYGDDLNLLVNRCSKIHGRMITNVKFWYNGNEKCWFIISTGLDHILKLTKMKISPDCAVTFEELASTGVQACTGLELHPNGDNMPSILVCKADFTKVTCYEIMNDHQFTISYNIALNNTEFSSHSFSVRAMTIIEHSNPILSSYDNDTDFLIVLTSHIPYMRVIVAELPKRENIKDELSEKDPIIPTYWDKIRRNIATEIFQDNYSQPVVTVLDQCKGIIIGADKGIYGLDVNTGDSWKLDMPNFVNDERVKCLSSNRGGSAFAAGLANKSVHQWSVL